MQTDKKQRNKHFVGFSNEEFLVIKKAADQNGLLPRQVIIMKLLGKL